MKQILIMLMLVYSVNVLSQDYKQQIESYREKFKTEIITEERAPLKTDQLTYLRFFDPDESYRITADFSKTENAKPFDMVTSSGKTKQYIEYGKVKFLLHGKSYTLTLYQGLKLLENPETKD